MNNLKRNLFVIEAITLFVEINKTLIKWNHLFQAVYVMTFMKSSFIRF